MRQIDGCTDLSHGSEVSLVAWASRKYELSIISYDPLDY